MKFNGWQKTSLTDYPGKVSAVLFTSGCNFNCEYCHNFTLKKYSEGLIEEDEVFDFFRKRNKTHDALVISGGEPSLQMSEVIEFAERFKERFPDKKIKVDTNGSLPEFLEKAVIIFDFIAMDFKSLNYFKFSSTAMETIQKSLIILSGFKNHEIRITAYPPYIPEKDFTEIIRFLRVQGILNIKIQQYRKINEVEPYSGEIIENFRQISQIQSD